MAKSIEDKAKLVIAEQLGYAIEKIKPESRFIEDLGADSLDLVELVMATEEAFNIQISDEESEKLTTVQQALDYLEARVKPPKPGKMKKFWIWVYPIPVQSDFEIEAESAEEAKRMALALAKGGELQYHTTEGGVTHIAVSQEKVD